MKKLFAVLLIVVMLLACTSCNGTEPSNNDYGDWYSSIDWGDGWDDDNVDRWEDVIVEDIIVEDIIVEDIIVEEIIIN